MSKFYDGIAEKTIKNFMRKIYSSCNVYIPTVAIQDRAVMEQFLQRFYRAFDAQFENKQVASKLFKERLLQIDVVRLDNQDENVYPLKLIFDNMRDFCDGDLEGGMFIPSSKSGVFLLDMDFIAKSKAEGFYTLTHELVHAMALLKKEKDGYIYYQSGLANENKIFYKINEGIVEYITRILWSKMYKKHPCPNQNNYIEELNYAKILMSLFPSFDSFIEDYFENSSKIFEQMKEIKVNGKSLYNELLLLNEDTISQEKIKNFFLNIAQNRTEDFNVKNINKII